MNKHNKNKLKEVVKSSAENKNYEYFFQPLSFKESMRLIAHDILKTKRICLMYSCLDKGMSYHAAYDYAFKKDISVVISMLDSHGWEISFGKLD